MLNNTSSAAEPSTRANKKRSCSGALPPPASGRDGLVGVRRSMAAIEQRETPCFGASKLGHRHVGVRFPAGASLIDSNRTHRCASSEHRHRQRMVCDLTKLKRQQKSRRYEGSGLSVPDAYRAEVIGAMLTCAGCMCCMPCPCLCCAHLGSPRGVYNCSGDLSGPVAAARRCMHAAAAAAAAAAALLFRAPSSSEVAWAHHTTPTTCAAGCRPGCRGRCLARAAPVCRAAAAPVAVRGHLFGDRGSQASLLLCRPVWHAAGAAASGGAWRGIQPAAAAAAAAASQPTPHAGAAGRAAAAARQPAVAQAAAVGAAAAAGGAAAAAAAAAAAGAVAGAGAVRWR